MVFKLAHLSDLHLDYKAGARTSDLGVNLRELDGYRQLEYMVTNVIDAQVDAVLVAGDFFHSPMVSMRAITVAQKQLLRFAHAGIKVYLLAGNHEVSDRVADVASSKVLDNPDLGIFSHVEPHIKYEISDGIFLHMVSHHAYDLQAETIRNIVPVKDAVNIFATHGAIIDPLLQFKLHTEQSPREIIIPDQMINQEEWDFRLLGHIHERGFVGSRDGGLTDSLGLKTFYNGSLLRRGFSDKPCVLERGWTLWAIDDNGGFTPSYKNIPQRPQIDFPVIDASGLSAQDLTDMIVTNLRATVSGDDVWVAPILRQSIINLSPAQRGSVDWGLVDKSAKHAFSWGVKMSLVSARTIMQAKDSGTIGLSGCPSAVSFQDWVESCSTISMVPEKIRESVIEQSSGFVKIGEERTFNETAK